MHCVCSLAYSPVSSMHASHSPLASKRRFCTENYCLLNIFLRWLCRKVSADLKFFSPTTMAHSESLICLCPRSDAGFDLQQVLFSMSTCLKALMCCSVIDWLDICINKLGSSQCQLKNICNIKYVTWLLGNSLQAGPCRPDSSFTPLVS